MTPKLALSLDEAAEAIGCSRSTVERRIRDDDLPCVRLGSRRVVPVRALEQWLEDRAHQHSVAEAS